MTMHTMLFKEHQGAAEGVLSAVPWWNGLGSQPPLVTYGEAFAQSKMASLEVSGGGAKQAPNDDHRLGLGAGKGDSTHQFALFSGDCKSTSEKIPIHTAAVAMDCGGHFELGFGQPLVCGKYPYAEQLYGVSSVYGSQAAGQGRVMLPLSMSTDGGPIFVNAKQYNGIMRRRRKRAEAELENKVLKLRKPYLHLSRHLHAMRRPRGNGGRFLNTRSTNGSILKMNRETAADRQQMLQGTESQVSEVFESDGGANWKGLNMNANSSRSTSPISEVSSHHLFSRDHPHHHHQSRNPFHINRLHPLFQPFPDVADTGLGIAMASGNY